MPAVGDGACAEGLRELCEVMVDVSVAEKGGATSIGAVVVARVLPPESHWIKNSFASVAH